MRYLQIPVSAAPFLQRVADFLETLSATAAAERVETVGDWEHELSSGPPEADVDLPMARRSASLVESHIDLRRELDNRYEVRAVHYYPAGGGMGWHTNATRPGWRIYVPRVTGLSPSSGIALIDRRIPDRRDYANVFRVGPGAWHAVYANTPRFSAGVRFADGDPFIEAVLQHPDALEC